MHRLMPVRTGSKDYVISTERKLVSVRGLTTRVAMVPRGERPTVLTHTADHRVTRIATGTCLAVARQGPRCLPL